MKEISQTAFQSRLRLNVIILRNESRVQAGTPLNISDFMFLTGYDLWADLALNASVERTVLVVSVSKPAIICAEFASLNVPGIVTSLLGSPTNH